MILILLILIGLIVGLVIWTIKLFRLYKTGKRKSFTIQICILTTLIVFATWKLQIFPLSENFYIKEQTTKLTGKSFWSWKEFSYDEWGVRGEGYTLYISIIDIAWGTAQGFFAGVYVYFLTRFF